MKIQKFNEAINLKKYHICMIINSASEIDYSGVFETEQDMDNWLLNLVNEIVLDRSEGDEEVFIDVVDAINWIQDNNDCNVYYDDAALLYKDVKLKYGVEMKINAKKYNI